MCQSLNQGGQRCAAHTRPPFQAVLQDLGAANTFARSRVRQARTGTSTNLMVVRDHASTPQGAKDVTRAISDFQGAGDQQTVAWLRNAMNLGAQHAAANKATAKAIKTEATKVKRAASLSSSTLRPTRGVTAETSLAAVYPDIAAQWDVEKNGGLTPEQVTPYINARVHWVCEQGHTWEARCNNRTNRARSGATPWCPECHGYRQQRLENMQENLARFVQAVDSDPDAWESLSPAMRHAILARTGMLSGTVDGFERSTALSMIHGDLTLRDVVNARDVSDIASHINEDLSSDDGALAEGDGIATPSVGPDFTGGDSDTRVDRIMAAAGTAALVADDEVLVSQITRENVESLWNEAYNSPDGAEAVLARVRAGADRNAYRAMVAEAFQTELSAVQAMTLPEGYDPSRILPDGTEVTVEPLLSQKRFALLVEQRRAVMNWSGTGAGKTLSAVLSTRQVGAQETLVMCPLPVVRQWKAEFEAAYPDTDVRVGLPPEGEDLSASHTGRPRVWIANYDKFSTDPSTAAERLGPLAQRLDAAVFDEIHLAKAADPKAASKRHHALQRFMDTAREANPDLAVVGQSATPVVTNLEEVKSLLRLTSGEDPKGFGTEATVKNAALAYQHLSAAGVRWRPNYAPTLDKSEVAVDISANVGTVMARVQAMGEGKPGATSRPALMERALLPEKLPAITAEVRASHGPVVVYSQYVAGMVDPIRDHLRAQGFTAERYTGEESAQERADLLRRFQTGEVKVLVGSKPIATGVDGLQRVSRNMVVASAAWTATDDDQLVGRIYRQGQTEDVRVAYIRTEAKAGDLTWSWDARRFARIKFRRSLADAAVDGVMPDRQLTSEATATADAVEALGRLVEVVAPASERTPVAA